MYFCLAEGRAPINMKIQKLRPQGQGYKYRHRIRPKIKFKVDLAKQKVSQSNQP